MTEVIYTTDPALQNPGRMLRSMVQDLMNSRELAWRLFVRNISAQYRQTIFGYVWAFLPPLLAAATFIMLRKGGVVSHDSLITIPYAAWVLTGAFIWQTFSDSLNSPIRLVAQSKAMLIKINFPREALLLAGVGEVLFNFLIRAAILVLILPFFDLKPGWGIFLFPLPFTVLILIGLVCGLLLTPLALLYQDVEKAVPLFLPFLMLISGAVIPLPSEGIGSFVGRWNPVFAALDSTRALICGLPVAHVPFVAVSGFVGFFLLFFGWVLYHVAMPQLIARIGS